MFDSGGKEKTRGEEGVVSHSRKVPRFWVKAFITFYPKTAERLSVGRLPWIGDTFKGGYHWGEDHHRQD